MRSSLLTQANRHLAVAGVTLILLAVGVAWVSWEHILDAYARRLAALTAEHYQAQIAEDRQAWNASAQRLRAQMEFLRLGEMAPEKRRASLLAFFNAQGEFREFAAILLVNAASMPVFGMGCLTMLQESLDVMQLASSTLEDWYARGHCVDDNAVHFITHTALWLGPDGPGTALYAARLDHAYLGRLARKGDTLYLLHDHRVRATSEGSARMADPIDIPDIERHPRLGNVLRVVVPLGSEGKMDDPLLIVHHPLIPLLSTRDFMLGVGMTILALIGSVWLLIGRLIRLQLMRLNRIGQGAQRFETHFRRDSAWQRLVDSESRHHDELAQLTRNLDALMDEVEARHREQRAFKQTLDMLEEVVVELDLAGRLTRVSSAWEQVVGSDSSNEILGKPLASFLDEEDAPALGSLVASLARDEKSQVHARLRLPRRNDTDDGRWLELRLARASGSHHLRGVLRDITQGYLQERRISHMALHDALTGLPNRILLEDRLQMAMRVASQSQHKVALGFIDLDHFKNINDSLGHKTGDALLIALARRLRQHLRAGDTLARWGGDEFVVLLPEMPDIESIREVAHELHAAMHAPLEVEGHEMNITFSAGFAIYPDNTDDAEKLLSLADRAMFYAKTQGRNNLQFFVDLSQKRLGNKDIYIQQRLLAAIREKRIENHYQPLICAKSGRVLGVETLARWFEPDLGWISPATFIPMAENLGVIRELGEQVWHQALRDLHQPIGHGLSLSVNLSKRQVFMPFFTEKLLEDVAAYDLSPQSITLEITESLALLDVEYSADRLRELREAGFRLSIDDFGTGYSSLSQLHELPAHELKIDLSFIKRIHEPQGTRLIQTIVNLAANLGLTTVAEGVEDAEAARILAQMGVDILQGWHFGRAMTGTDLRAWLAAHNSTEPC